jgi:16S rRNA (cytosine967-C5)-methyltransferase
MVLEDLRDGAPEWALDLVDERGFLRTLPHLHGMDGFFAALFSKPQELGKRGKH